ncbi:hypothetical protein ACQKND_19090 [Viridibacillus arvi]
MNDKDITNLVIYITAESTIGMTRFAVIEVGVMPASNMLKE